MKSSCLMMTFLALLFPLGLFLPDANAAITYGGIDENTASFTEVPQVGSTPTTTTPPTIYGGVAGAATSCASTNNTVCDNCPTNASVSTLTPCNQRRVYDDLQLIIRFTTNNAALTNGTIQAQMGDMLQPSATFMGSATSPLVIPNTTMIAAIRWSEICKNIPTEGAYAGTPSCDSLNPGGRNVLRVGIIPPGAVGSGFSEQISFNVIVQPMRAAEDGFHQDCGDVAVKQASNFDTRQGLCRFSVFPGDQKIYLQELEAPNESGSSIQNLLLTRYNQVGFRFLNVYGKELLPGSNLCSANPTGSLSAELGTFNLSQILKHQSLISFSAASTSFQVQSTEVRGLTNESCYGFFIGTQDFAGNVGFFSPTSFLDKYALLPASPVTAQPSEVLGLLTEEDARCFIATAAFNSPNAPEVKLLRWIRDQILLKFDLGRQFVDAYYFYSPPIAQAIQSSDALRFSTQLSIQALLVCVLLLPFILFGMILRRAVRLRRRRV